MKHLVNQACSQWFAIMTPVHAPLTTVEARETMRKRHLLSIILLIAILCVTGPAGIGFLTNANKEIPLQMFAGICFMLISLWINRCGYLKWASLVYLLSSFIGIAGLVLTVSQDIPVASLGICPILLVIPVSAGLFLPAWGPLLATFMTELFVCWFLLIERRSQIAIYMSVPGDRLLLFAIIFLTIAVIGGFCAIASAATRKAVIQADRTFEVEQANRDLAQAYTNLETAHTTIQKQALTDGLTGLLNHRAVLDQLEKELRRASRYSHPFSVLFLDVDRFKHVNDTYGHSAGDTVLCQVGERAGSAMRGGDTLGRFGGEEFVLLLPEADTNEASLVAERIRATIANESIALTELEGGLNVTVSIGVATYPTDVYGEQELLQLADQAMYMAKRLGRNQVRTAPEVVQMSVDVELMAILQQDEQSEAQDRAGITPERIRENYTVKIISSLMTLLERRDHGMSQHAYAVSDLATSLAQALGLEQFQISRIGIAALLHDIGKIAIPDILLQKSGHLTPHERALLKEHAELGGQILEACPFLYDLIPVVRHHHEHWDGNGYPDQLTHEDIPLAARIIAVAEAFDAMVRERPYQTCRTSEEALKELWRCAGTQFDPAIVQAFSTLQTELYEHHKALQTIG